MEESLTEAVAGERNCYVQINHDPQPADVRNLEAMVAGIFLSWEG
jgi:hypothetical protein